MSNQIFKNKISNDVFFEFLNSICLKNEKYLILNIDAFKKGIYNNKIIEFFDYCKPFYQNSKKKYLEKKLTYNSFNTVIRQICNLNNTKFVSFIKYDKSIYNIIYYIYFN